MAIIIRYVVEHKGVEKFVTADKKEADKYDKMLDLADNLSEYIEAKGIELEASVLKELSVMLAKNSLALGKLIRGTSAKQVLDEDTAEVITLDKKKA
jgi:uncharacterized protein